MNLTTICLIIIATCILGFLYIAAVFSNLNDIHETETDEPLGDMVDVRAIVKKYSED